MVLAAGSPRILGTDTEPRLRFGGAADALRPQAGRRRLWLDGEPAFELSFWCGTCQFLFERLDGASSTCSVEAADRLLVGASAGIDDELVAMFGALLARGSYLPLLLSVEPRLVFPSGVGDYFAGEQVATWGVTSFWGLPEYPRTPYYRTYETRIDEGAHLFEFVVPMVPPSWNEADRVAEHAAALVAGAAPTAVAVSILDVCAPAMDNGTDYYTHWGLTHFLLDGHHKMQAAAETGRPLRLLSLLSVGAGLASAEQVGRIPRLRARSRAGRPPGAEPVQ